MTDEHLQAARQSVHWTKMGFFVGIGSLALGCLPFIAPLTPPSRPAETETARTPNLSPNRAIGAQPLPSKSIEADSVNGRSSNTTTSDQVVLEAVRKSASNTNALSKDLETRSLPPLRTPTNINKPATESVGAPVAMEYEGH